MSIVLGIDPGFAHFGFAAVQLLPEGEHVLEMGVVETQKSPAKHGVLASDDNLRRAREIASRLHRLIDKHHALALAVESMSFVRNASASQKIGIAWGVLASVAEARGLPIVSASPQQIKSAVCGSKSASKDDVASALVLRYGKELAEHVIALPKGRHEHAFDGLGAVVAALGSDVVRLARQMTRGAA